MASSENLASMEPWTFRPTTFADSWISEAFARDTETLTKALQKSIANTTSGVTVTSDTIAPFFNLIKHETPAASGISGSDPETAPRRHRNGSTGKITKRKSRASKRSQTTFITADPANFRQMVQQVTGVKFGNSQMQMQMQMAPILKPEPQRPSNRLQGCLPTLDTSAFLLDHRQMVVPTGSPSSGQGHVSFAAPPIMVAEGGAGLDFDTFSSFPTLESWKVQ